MNSLASFHPALILLAGALVVPLLRGSWRSAWTLALPVLALVNVLALPSPGEGAEWTGWTVRVVPWLSEPLTFLRVDRLSKAFAIIFSINAIAAFLFASYGKGRDRHGAALVYIGAALGAVFAGDLISLYLFWELMAIASTFVILARRTEGARDSAYRYLLIHVFGGLLFLAGLAVTVALTGTIAFDGFDFATDQHAGTWLILLGFLVNAAAPPFSAWLSDAYPEAGVTGGLILSAYTTKTAVYALLRGYDGWEPLIWVGCLMSIYGIVYALLENDMRRILAYSIINQVGFMVCAAGIGGPIAISGATAHAFCHILYKSLLWMSAGAVLYRVGKSKCTDLGGLYKTMPWTLVFGGIGALAISAVPLTSGFTSKTLILHAAEQAHLFWPWLILEAASAGVFLHAGIKFPYFVFFNQDRGLRPKEAPAPMLLAMGLLAFLCLYLGVHPQPLYDLLPHRVDYNAWTLPHVIAQGQILVFSALVFFLFLPLLKRTATISLDTDWFYRRGGRALYRLADRGLNAIDAGARRLGEGLSEGIAKLAESGAPRLLCLLLTPLWKLAGHDAARIAEERLALHHRARAGAFPVGLTAFCAVVLLGLLTIVYYGIAR